MALSHHTIQYKTVNTIRIMLVGCCLFSASLTHAQELEYKMELGAMGGGCFYMGDANLNIPFKHTSWSGGLLARYNLNPRMVIKGDLGVANVKGSTKGLSNTFPENGATSFSNNVYDLTAQFEYSFFAYGTGAGFKDSHRLSPYISGGVGFTLCTTPQKVACAMNIPLSIGVKFKLMERVNLGAEWTMRFTTTDRLDESKKDDLQLNDPYHIKSKGFKNKDSYSLARLYISYDLFPKYRKCNNL